MKGFTIRLYPNKEQEILMRKHIGCQRYIYNWGLNLNNKLYETKQKKYSVVELGKMLTQYKKEVDWLNEVSNATLKEALRNLDKAYNNFYKCRAKLPKFKSKKKSNDTFYSRYEKIKFYENNTVNLEKIGKVKCKSSYNVDFTQITKFSNPNVTFNGRCWVLRFSIEIKNNHTELTDKVLGIDLGIKQLAIVNEDGLDIPNINKTKVVKNLEKKLKRLQRKCSRKYENNREGGRYQKTKNIVKLELKIKKLHRKLKNIKLNYIHQATSKMVKTKPKIIVTETLKISNMMRNRHLAKSIAQQCFYKFIEQMKYKCKYNGIEFIQVPIFYPSSKMCSCCGSIKKDLKLSDRTYKCNCGFICDRDKNAAYNLANYGLEISL
ncbi:RNA-guided endonuclease TnpB family protein [Paraclostridium ghonii]|uniref:Transposase n=1 Tax=Paraclostridium ghonii TaxID=29358 RepID=A0ABU0MXL8_9FIRM|nr:RNA-guided endonuclease TnpB family protein [Paeniclostridium ghonii]MDQ0555605.1 putative transposase [Paeniclostridium ghonii]